jgi:hypothetical protein
VLFLILLPFVFVGIALVAAIVCVQLSWLRITSAGVELRNYPQAPKHIPLAQVGHFEATTATGNFKSIRPATGVLVLTDGSRVPVRKVAAPDAGYGVDALNARIDELR